MTASTLYALEVYYNTFDYLKSEYEELTEAYEELPLDLLHTFDNYLNFNEVFVEKVKAMNTLMKKLFDDVTLLYQQSPSEEVEELAAGIEVHLADREEKGFNF